MPVPTEDRTQAQVSAQLTHTWKDGKIIIQHIGTGREFDRYKQAFILCLLTRAAPSPPLTNDLLNFVYWQFEGAPWTYDITPTLRAVLDFMKWRIQLPSNTQEQIYWSGSNGVEVLSRSEFMQNLVLSHLDDFASRSS